MPWRRRTTRNGKMAGGPKHEKALVLAHLQRGLRLVPFSNTPCLAALATRADDAEMAGPEGDAWDMCKLCKKDVDVNAALALSSRHASRHDEFNDMASIFSGATPELGCPRSYPNPGKLNRLPGYFLRSYNSPEPSKEFAGPRIACWSPGPTQPFLEPQRAIGAHQRDCRLSAQARAVPGHAGAKPRIAHWSCDNSGDGDPVSAYALRLTTAGQLSKFAATRLFRRHSLYTWVSFVLQPIPIYGYRNTRTN